MFKLSHEIHSSHKKLVHSAQALPTEVFFKKNYIFSSLKVSAADIIAYQIGWGSLLINWYKSGIANEKIILPGEGFNKWLYKDIALHFFDKYAKRSYDPLFIQFNAIVTEIIGIVEQESNQGTLDKEGVWDWCKLRSGKEWPLSKWVRVNTVAPYKRATKLLQIKDCLVSVA